MMRTQLLIREKRHERRNRQKQLWKLKRHSRLVSGHADVACAGSVGTGKSTSSLNVVGMMLAATSNSKGSNLAKWWVAKKHLDLLRSSRGHCLCSHDRETFKISVRKILAESLQEQFGRTAKAGAKC